MLTSLVAQTAKRLSTMRETRVQALGWEDPLEKEMAIHSRTIVWKIPWTEEPGRLQPMGSQRVRHDWATSLSLLKLISYSKSVTLQWKKEKIILCKLGIKILLPQVNCKNGDYPSCFEHRILNNLSMKMTHDSFLFLSQPVFSRARLILLGFSLFIHIKLWFLLFQSTWFYLLSLFHEFLAMAHLYPVFMLVHYFELIFMYLFWS